MKFFESLWILTDNDAMDVTQITLPPAETADPINANQPGLSVKNEYSNIINLLDYIKLKKQHAY